MAVIRVGRFELSPSERTLCCDGKPLELGARAFDLLLVLVEHQGRLATKATLLERVWPRLVVDENNLPAQIASLRRLLGAGAIRTVAGFGYRLELPVSAADAPLPKPTAPAPLQPVRRTWPNRLGPLIGRERTLAELLAVLERTDLVTVVGAAGVGKSRLAQEILAQQADDRGEARAWIALQPVTEVEHVPSAIALALGVALPQASQGFGALSQALEGSSLLLVLDGAEHLGDALAAPLADLIGRNPGLRAVVTSQAPLGVPGETVYRLEALGVPTGSLPPEEAMTFGAVELFSRRAAAADQRFELSGANHDLVVEICRRLDGNPLAIELAAARVPSLGMAAILDRLNDRFRLLKASGRTADPRHGALHTALDWSYNLLTSAEQRVFNRLGAFAGTFSLQAAAVCVADESIDTAEAIDLLGRLVDRSLLSALPVEPPRYALPETARFYARGKLAAAGELESAQARMARTMLGLLDGAYLEYWALDEAIWLNRYAMELDNLRAALAWALDNDRELAIGLYGSAWPLFVEADLLAEASSRYEEMLKRLSESLPRGRTARFWEAVATYNSTRQCDRARFAAELAASMHAATADARARYYCLLKLAFNCRDDEPAAKSAFEAARQLEDPAWPARLLAHGALTEGALLLNTGEFADARAAYRRAVRFALTVSERQALEASVSIVELDIACGDLAAALQLGRPLALSLHHAGRRDTRFDLLGMTFSALLLNGEIVEAGAAGAELFELARLLDTGKLYTALDAMACLACLNLRFETAARILALADSAHQAHGQARRRPVQERLRALVLQTLEGRCIAPLRAAGPADSRDVFDEVAACSLALGLRS